MNPLFYIVDPDREGLEIPDPNGGPFRCDAYKLIVPLSKNQNGVVIDFQRYLSRVSPMLCTGFKPFVPSISLAQLGLTLYR